MKKIINLNREPNIHNLFGLCRHMFLQKCINNKNTSHLELEKNRLGKNQTLYHMTNFLKGQVS